MGLEVQVIGLVIGLSGWGKVLYDYITSTPRIRGQVFQVMRGTMEHERQRLTMFTTYLYLVNTRKNAVHLLDYELEVRTNGKWEQLKRVYGIHKIPNISFSARGGEIKIDKFADNLIYRKSKAIEFGSPLHGWIVFAGPEQFHGVDITSFRLTCIDAFYPRHKIVTEQKKPG